LRIWTLVSKDWNEKRSVGILEEGRLDGEVSYARAFICYIEAFIDSRERKGKGGE